MNSDIQVSVIRDKQLIENFFRKDPLMHLYEIGDLDDFFWPQTRWIALGSEGNLISILLLYEDFRMPVLLALNHKPLPPEVNGILLLKHLLPSYLNAHLSTEFKDLLNQVYHMEYPALHFKMGFSDYSCIRNKDFSQVIRLGTGNRNELLELYRISYPGNWFHERMLQTGQYYGLKINNQLVSVAGVHVYSEKYRVAALGNITTHPNYRNQGLAEIVTACLCEQLAQRVDHIGLNVHTDNLSAIRCYQKLGFEILSQFEECRLTSRE
jgi:ribosomal protein S18 acetylase RimI-like enzyme